MCFVCLGNVQAKLKTKPVCKVLFLLQRLPPYEMLHVLYTLYLAILVTYSQFHFDQINISYFMLLHT